MQLEHFSVDERFCGPPRSGNGGYVCGRVARHFGPGPVAVRLKAPPPLAIPLRLEYSAGGAQLSDDTTLIAEARPAALDLVPPPAPAWPMAEAASRHFAGFRRHKFPGCFVCGTLREPGDGLRIFAGAMNPDPMNPDSTNRDFAGRSPVLAAPWIPDPSLRGHDGHVAPEFLWAALDCPGAFAVDRHDSDTALVLGELCAVVEHAVSPGEPCVVLGWPLGSDGRKHQAGTAVYAGGRLIAHARAIWIEVPLADWT